MAHHVLILNSSPRTGGNTDQLTEALTEGIREQGNSTRTIHLRKLTLRPCLGRYLCREGKGNPCIQKDDMNRIYNALERSDSVVLAAPLYWWQFNAEMVIVIDRLCALATTGEIPKLNSAMVIAGGDVSPHNFTNLVDYYENYLVKLFGWTNKGMLLADGIDMPGDIEGTDYLQQARALGALL